MVSKTTGRGQSRSIRCYIQTGGGRRWGSVPKMSHLFHSFDRMSEISLISCMFMYIKTVYKDGFIEAYRLG